MDLGRYRELMGRFHDVVLACEGRASKASGKWVTEFDRELATRPDDHRLRLHLAHVRRSAYAIAILAVPTTPNDSIAVSKGLTESAASELLAEVKRIEKTLEETRAVLEDRGIQGLIREALSSVTFLMDYAQFDFNGSSLTTFVWPEWSQGSNTLEESDPSYRNALCGLIGAQVATVIEEPSSLALGFENGVTLKVSLSAEEAQGPECATFISETGLLWVW